MNVFNIFRSLSPILSLEQRSIAPELSDRDHLLDSFLQLFYEEVELSHDSGIHIDELVNAF